jgi:hypothetical protein
MGLVLENWRTVSVSNPYPTNSASGGPAQSSSYDNLILANYIVMPSFVGIRERLIKEYHQLDSDAHLTFLSPNRVHVLT